MRVEELCLSESEKVETERLLNDIFRGEPWTVEAFLKNAALTAHGLPRSVRSCLNDLRTTESASAVCIRNNPISHELEPTPETIPKPSQKVNVTREEALLLLHSSLMGEPFTWSSIQNGNLINEIIPIAEHANEPMSSGSSNTFGLHTEDAFHEFRGEYLALFCMRNPTRTPTLLSSVNDVRLSEREKAILMEPRYIVGSNRAHAVASTASCRAGVLLGHPSDPYLRINTNRDPEIELGSEAAAAYSKLVGQLEAGCIPYVLMPGDCLVIDNYKVAHGRSAYTPSYDGYDRWLKRVYITSSLRRSRALRASVESRIIQLQ